MQKHWWDCLKITSLGGVLAPRVLAVIAVHPLKKLPAFHTMAAAHHVLAHSSEAEVKERAAACVVSVLSSDSVSAFAREEVSLLVELLYGNKWSAVSFKHALLKAFGPGGRFVGSGECEDTERAVDSVQLTRAAKGWATSPAQGMRVC